MKHNQLGLAGIVLGLGLTMVGCTSFPAILDNKITEIESTQLIPQNIVMFGFYRKGLVIGYDINGDRKPDEIFFYDMSRKGDSSNPFFPKSYYPLKYDDKKKIPDNSILGPDKVNMIGIQEGAEIAIEDGTKTFFFKMTGSKDSKNPSALYPDSYYSVQCFSESP